MQALPLFLDRIVPSYMAIILSVTLVLFFGEIIPSAIFTVRYAPDEIDGPSLSGNTCLDEIDREWQWRQ